MFCCQIFVLLFLVGSMKLYGPLCQSNVDSSLFSVCHLVILVVALCMVFPSVFVTHHHVSVVCVSFVT